MQQNAVKLVSLEGHYKASHWSLLTDQFPPLSPPFSLSLGTRVAKAVRVGAGDLMSDLFILTDTEPELTVPTHKYIK